MPAGIEVYDATGFAVLSITDRTYRVLTVEVIGTAQSGVIPLSGLDTGNVAVIVTGTNGYAPNTSVSGSGVSWDYGSIPSGNRDPNQALHIVLY